RRSHRRGRDPSVGGRVVATAGIESGIGVSESVDPAPDDHFPAGPHGGVINPFWRRAAGRGRHPAVGGWIVATAVIEPTIPRVRAAPDDHLASRPNRAVTEPPGGSPGRR